MTTQDIWLRKRDGHFELKVPMSGPLEERITDSYQELESDQEIIEYLKLSSDKSLQVSLEENEYKPFCEFTTTRRKYKRDGFIIDLDSVDFGYSIAEIECMVEDVLKAREATGNIVQYGRMLGLKEGLVRGKVTEYLRRNNQPHFQALVKAKVIKPD